MFVSQCVTKNMLFPLIEVYIYIPDSHKNSNKICFCKYLL